MFTRTVMIRVGASVMLLLLATCFAQADVVSTYTRGTPPGPFDTDFVNGASHGGPANANGVTLTLSSIPSDVYLGRGDLAVGDGNYWVEDINESEHCWAIGFKEDFSDYTYALYYATYDFTTPVNIQEVNAYVSHASWGAYMNCLVEVDTGAGWTMLKDARGEDPVPPGQGGENTFKLTDDTAPGVANIASGVVGLRVGFDQTAGGFWTVIREIDVHASPVPEPGAVTLLACGLLSLLAYAWRKRR